MARIRSIKPEFWTDRKTARMSRDARLLYIAIWNHADEHARVHGDPRYIKGHCLPYDDDLNLTDIDALIDELARHGRVVRYTAEGDPFLFLPKLADHQRLEPHKSASRLPEPPDDDPPGEPQTPSDDPPGKSAQSPEDLRPTAGPIVVQQVAGSRLHVAGSRLQGSPPPAGGADLLGESEGQYVNRLTKTYTDRVPLSNFPAVAGVVRKASRADYTEQDITRGLTALADDGRAVTTDALRYAIDGMPARRATGKKAEQDAVLLSEMAAARAGMNILELPGGAA